MSRYTDANDRPMEAIEAGREAEEDRLNASRATDTRSRFEAWADGHGLWYERGPAPYTNTEDRNGKYLDPVTETAWECWQAARSSGEPGGKQAAFDAEFATAIVDAAVPHAELDVYTSNSYRRVGLKGDYREVLYACKQNDGHLDIKNTPLLQAMVIAFNAMLARQPPETLSPPERSSPTKPEPDKKRPRTSFERFVDSLPPTKPEVQP